MSLDNIVTLNISRSAAAVSRQGFGTALILGPNATGWSSDRIRSYTKAADMLDDGFDDTDPEYLAALRLFSQPVKPALVKVGRSLTPVAQVETIDLAGSVANSTVYRITINGTDFQYTSDSSATEAEVHGGLLALINAGAEPVTASGGTTNLVVTADEAGIGFTVDVSTNLSKTPTMPNTGVASDLAQISQIDDDWYALVITSRDDDVILQAAGYIESVRKIFAACSGAAGIIAAGSTDIASLLKARTYDRTFLLYSADQAKMPEAAELGNVLPRIPGAWTMKFKSLAGIAVDALTSTQVTTAKAKNANVYTTVGGANVVEEGVVASGEFVDTVVGLDWLHANMQSDIFQALRDIPKLPYTDQGAAVIENIVRSRLRLAQLAGILAESPAPVVTVPAVADQDPADRAARRMAGIEFQATLAGAIHAVTINGYVSV